MKSIFKENFAIFACCVNKFYTKMERIFYNMHLQLDKVPLLSITCICSWTKLECIHHDWHNGLKVNYQINFIFGEVSLFPWKSIWKVKAPSCIAFFTWTASLGKILTISNLRRQGLTLVNWCCLCKKNEKTVNHLFIHCEFTSDF